MDYLKITAEPLSVADTNSLVLSPDCGAVSMFIGTTRDNFEGKTVVKLEYEAYEDMAFKSLQKICSDMRGKWPQIVNIAIFHRVGEVPVKEASIIIAISSPHREDSLQATQWCIDIVKKTVPIWKKEVYEGGLEPVWKENKEYTPPLLNNTSDKPELNLNVVKQGVVVPTTPSHLIQIKCSKKEVEERIDKFIERKRNEINRCNVRDFCRKTASGDDEETSCARVDSVLIKRKDSKGHLQVNRVYNTYNRDQTNADYLTKYIPKNGVDERIENLESQLSLTTPVPRSIYIRLKELENRLLYLESISPEYIQFWEKNTTNKSFKKKRIYSIQEVDRLILELETKRQKR
ncbi:molybdopterin synthase catalytic subunit [Onthophagus taurus]|uniref:molybdopterin synthase catalytic subunit n=1 Tax=Onthophagus taurus TaxID=166361 RepID=UPI0039BE6445